jgi:DNA-binding LytR/AlgR family response regulator
MIRVIVADAEPRARQQLRDILAERQDVEVVGEAGTGSEVLRLVRELAPDIAFLDVAMPDLTGAEMATALERARTAIVFMTAYDRHAVVMHALRARHGRSDRIFLTADNRTVIKRVCDIDWVEAQGKTLQVRSGGTTFVTPGPLNDLEARLDASVFVRVARAFLVNLDRVVEVQPWYGGELLLIMADGARIPTSRAYRARLDPIIGRVPRRDK